MTIKFAKQILSLSLGAFLISGCSHRLEVKNLNEFRSSSLAARLGKPASIGVNFESDYNNLRPLVKEVATELQKYTSEVVFPYNPNGYKKADVEARVDIRPSYRGSGVNFLINFPGFLVWAPAWNGYVYKAELKVKVDLVDTQSGQSLDSFTLPINLDIRQAEIDRTWTEVSWLEVGVIALIGGMVFTQYDPDVTSPLIDHVRETLGKHIAEEIVNRLNATGKFSRIFLKDRTEWLALR